MSSAREEYITVLKALYDYDPTSEDELAVKEGQLLFLVERPDDEWWKVKHKPDTQDGETSPAGLVPASYLEEAEPTSVVKALYDYEATTPGELSIIEDETLSVYEKDDDWLLVKSERDGGKVGYVPGNYVEEDGEDKPVENGISHVVVPDSPPLRPTSTYVDPADRVAATVDKSKADDIQTWSVSEVDKKGKKKKGTLGVGNGAIFFASESDKTPVQKWQILTISDIKIEKSKHVHFDIGGDAAISLHFNVGSKDTADAIVRKLESSKAHATSMTPSTQLGRASPPSDTSPSPALSVDVSEAIQKPKKNGASVHFAASPAMIPSPDSPMDAETDEEGEIMPEGENGAALYDFVADGDDELTVKEGERLIILDRVSSEEWWKCLNIHGAEGVVPASYIEAIGPTTPVAEDDDEERERREEAEREEEAKRAAAAEAEAAAAKARERAEKERDRKKQEIDRQAKAMATAKAERERKERENREREEHALREREAAEKRLAEAAKRSLPDRRSIHEEEHNRASKARVSSEVQPKFPNEGKTRIWHDHSGQWRTEAEFLGINKGKIRLHKINGVVIEVLPEKMSPDDVRYIESITNRKLGTPAPATASRSRGKDDDDIPLGALSQRRSLVDASPTRPPPPKKASTIDWFEFFLNAGCEIDDCTRYASSFERDKMDEGILPDIKESTLRSLGLREGDIIRVSKAIEQRKPKSSSNDNDAVKTRLLRDEAVAKALQAEEDNGASSRHANTTSPPNLFAGPGGALKTQQRRGRPQPRGSAPPANVDVNSIASASDQLSRTGSPLVASPNTVRATSPAINPPKRATSTQPSGFDDDAWTNRPSSAKPTPTLPTITSVPALVSTPSVTVAPPTAPAPPPVSPAPAPVTASTLAPQPPQSTSTNPSTQDSSQFELLAKIGQMRPPSAPVHQTSILNRNSPAFASPLQSFHSGLGMGTSPVPLGQHLQNQQTGLYQQAQNGPRGPLAPVPSNQGLLNPLIPTTTGFNQFVPARPASAQPMGQSSFQSPGAPSFLQTPPTRFGATGSHIPQQTGFPGIAPQPTGFPGVASQQAGMFSGISSQPTGFGGGFGGPGNPNFMPSNGFGGTQPSYNPSFSSPLFDNGGLAPPTAAPPQKDHSPANVFAQMKSGTFGNESIPQSADKYDALRSQPTGWQNGFQPQGSYGGF
ncbi:hypothetical protein K439DRAFT_1380627 [Ramaria rubella]|nr:hypothetical protein K439DRAFT_1380627 [Ramaria rubella]